jgi:hypothetical protein
LQGISTVDKSNSIDTDLSPDCSQLIEASWTNKDQTCASVRYQLAEYHFSIDLPKKKAAARKMMTLSVLMPAFENTAYRTNRDKIQESDCQATAVESLIPVVM